MEVVSFRLKKSLSVFYPSTYLSVKICLTLLHSEWPKLHTILVFLGAIGLSVKMCFKGREIQDLCKCIFIFSYAHLSSLKICMFEDSSHLLLVNRLFFH